MDPTSASTTVLPALRAGLDMLAAGVLLVDRHRVILYANEQAERLLARGDGLFCHHDRLLAIEPDEDDAIGHLLAGLPIASTLEVSRGRGMTISRATGVFPYSLMAYPFRQGPEGRWMLFVTDPMREDAGLCESLSALYGLSDAESAVAAAISNGRDLRQIAVDRGSSVETVRTLLRRVFDKTGARRQIDLVRLISSGPGLLIAPSPCP